MSVGEEAVAKMLMLMQRFLGVWEGGGGDNKAKKRKEKKRKEKKR